MIETRYEEITHDEKRATQAHQKRSEGFEEDEAACGRVDCRFTEEQTYLSAKKLSSDLALGTLSS